MKEAPYVILILLVIIAAALFLGNSDPISAATGRAEASAVLNAVPAGGWIASEFLSTLFGIVLTGIVLGIAGVVIAQVRKWLRDRQYQRTDARWKAGPNAQWKQTAPKAPKSMTTEQLMQMAILQRLYPSGGGLPQSQPPVIVTQQPVDEDLELRF